MGQLMKNASSTERRAIQKVYKAAQRGEFNQDVQHRRARIADARKLLNKWLDGATDDGTGFSSLPSSQFLAYFFRSYMYKHKPNGKILMVKDLTFISP